MYVVNKKSRRLIISQDQRSRFFAYRLECIDTCDIEAIKTEWGDKRPEYIYKDSGVLYHWVGDLIEESDNDDLPMIKVGRIYRHLNKWYFEEIH